MLVLSRQRDEEVFIIHNGQIIGRVMCVEIRRDKVSIGFDLPNEYRVYRKEVWEKILKEQTDADDKERLQPRS